MGRKAGHLICGAQTHMNGIVPESAGSAGGVSSVPTLDLVAPAFVLRTFLNQLCTAVQQRLVEPKVLLRMNELIPVQCLAQCLLRYYVLNR